MIFLDNRQDKIEITEELEKKIVEIIEYTLKEEGVNIPSEISIIFIDNEEIRVINKEQRDIDKITDVLSFPMLDYEEGKVFKDMYLDYEFDFCDLNEGNLVLGDMALSLEKALEQSEEYGHSFIREVMYLVVHSILHLLGYDHIDENDKILMRKREEEILNKFNINRLG
ncbi:MAG: rRNA maturation RNase YbeY [Clostridium argentinense]|uniref:Endoribonuclease YbeY n=1 Tax=Clostridium faecium TaxID=2762223 RepID=A0ABR8YX21_9CLOT|nr:MULTISPECIES: rRNA maturation RNase YbeY [Clostridium]MBD8048828.1 rRNA maturation RNase YbeY [Clostridium faecium]MBS5823952.1 rRNA maturation RNase YbeY [Clostridium argentinense]MDU1348327.1 rRNA maturation RNase YbeY [Clostridium argentinense]